MYVDIIYVYTQINLINQKSLYYYTGYKGNCPSHMMTDVAEMQIKPFNDQKQRFNKWHLSLIVLKTIFKKKMVEKIRGAKNRTSQFTQLNIFCQKTIRIILVNLDKI